MRSGVKFFFAFLLSILTRGAIDYLPEANKPWVVDFRNPNRYPGRGRRLHRAFINYFRGNNA